MPVVGLLSARQVVRSENLNHDNVVVNLLALDDDKYVACERHAAARRHPELATRGLAVLQDRQSASSQIVPGRADLDQVSSPLVWRDEGRKPQPAGGMSESPSPNALLTSREFR